MNTNDKPMLTGLFRDRDSAERAYQSISDRGYTRDDVNVVMSDETRDKHFTGSAAGRETELGNKAAEGAGIGGAIGGSLGAIAAAIAAVGTTIALPGLGIVIAGPIAAAIAGAGAGAATGGHRRRAGRLGHPRRARQGIRPGHTRRRHPDGGAAEERGRRRLPRGLMALEPRRARVPLRLQPSTCRLTEREPHLDHFGLISSSSTSNRNVAFGGITPPAPRSP